MKLRSITLTDVRRFAGTSVRLDGIGDGLTVVTAPNEAGKSTFFDALDALFSVPARSAAAEVRALRPYAGGAPEVAAEIEIDGRGYRIAKRWLARPFARVTELASGRVLAQDDAAEHWIREHLAGTDRGPAALLWVRQGTTALEPEGRGVPEKAEQERLVAIRRDLLSSVAGEIDSITGGRRMDAIAARCEAALAELATATGRPRTGGAWKAAADEAERLAAELATLDGLCDELATALRERSRNDAALAIATDPSAARARAEAVMTARARLDAARTKAAEQAAAASDVRHAVAERTAADQALADLDRAVERQARAETARAEAVGRHGETGAALAEAATVEAAMEVAARDARDAHAAARASRETADRVARARGAAARLAPIEARLARAAALAARAEAADLEVATVSEAHVAAATAAANALDRARAQLDAGAVTLTVAYLPGAAPLTVAGRQLAEATPFAVAGPTVIELPGLGRLTVAPGGDATDAASAVKAAEAALAAALVPTGSPDLAALRSLAAARAEAVQQGRDARAELAGAAPEGLAALRAEAEGLRAEAAEASLDASDPDAARSAEDLARARDDQAAASLATARGVRIAAERDEIAARLAAEAAARTLQEASEEVAALPPRADLVQAVRERSDAAVVAEARAAALARDAADPLSAEAELLAAEAAVGAAARETHDLQRRQAGLGALISARADEGFEERRGEVAGQLEATEARAAHCAAEARALARLRDALATARAEARDRYLAPVMAELAPLVQGLLGEAELSLHPARLLPQTLTRGGLEEDLANLSGGTREQIAILTRLAFARLLGRGGTPIPVILDDPLVFADEARIERMRTVLEAVGAQVQIIILTCRDRPFATLPAARPRLRIDAEADTAEVAIV